MGVIKRYCYSVKCNYCEALLENYTGELIGLTNKREDAEEVAKENGWVQTGKNTWKCPECITKVAEKGETNA